MENPDKLASHGSDPPDRPESELGLAALWENARHAVFAQLIASVGSIHDAEDLLQEVAVAVAKNYHKHDQGRPFVAWALGIARNQALMYFRKQRRDRLAFGEDMMRVVATHLEATPTIGDDRRRDALHECLAAMSGERRSLLSMRYGRDMNLTEIARSLGKSVPAIKGKLFRVRKILGDCVHHRLAAR
ncbi:sigma-70 family RNA polymerase sigma factor [Posidoniimonas polymericola]|uniref:sigma-70 family RNA polymerase sigma factor n=1 Tax=Posidoniimonas polymericola TaxID=2528002 RepID=UPI0011B6E96E|nr:sigma-70 family RNA polymerase sigma factor [Posidoniimonas polymericola]